MRFVRRARNELAAFGLHLDMHEAPVAVEERDLIDEFVAVVAEPGGERLGLALRGGRFERRERLDEPMRLDFLARLGRVEADRLRRGGAKLGFGGPGGGGRHCEAQDRGEGYDRGATDEGERGHDFDQSLYPNGALMFA